MRYLEKFTDEGGSISYTFPLNAYEMETSQGLVVPFGDGAGAHYGYNQLASALAVKRNAIESVRCLIVGANAAAVDTAIDNARSYLYRAGKGKLYFYDGSSVRRWAWARLIDMPELRFDSSMIRHQPMSLQFARFSDWYGTTQYSTNNTMNESSESFSVVNDGNARVFNAVFTLKGTFANPVITNTTNGYRLKSTTDGTASGHWLRFDSGRNAVELSTNSGTTYTGDWANFVRLRGQVQLMVLEPGTNSFTAAFTGTPSATLNVAFYHAFH